MTLPEPYREWLERVCGCPPEPREETIEQAFRRELLERARRDIGIREVKPNDGPEIREWLKQVGIYGPAPYCAAWISDLIAVAAVRVGLARRAPHGDYEHLPIELSAGALKLAYNAGAAFVRQPIAVARPQPGDVLVWKRPTSTGASWTGHVGLNVECPTTLADTIEANVPDQRGREGVVERTRDLAGDRNYLGFIDWSRVPALRGGVR